jgi:hypothetical protein
MSAGCLTSRHTFSPPWSLNHSQDSQFQPLPCNTVHLVVTQKATAGNFFCVIKSQPVPLKWRSLACWALWVLMYSTPAPPGPCPPTLCILSSARAHPCIRSSDQLRRLLPSVHLFSHIELQEGPLNYVQLPHTHLGSIPTPWLRSFLLPWSPQPSCSSVLRTQPGIHCSCTLCPISPGRPGLVPFLCPSRVGRLSPPSHVLPLSTLTAPLTPAAQGLLA